MIVSAPSGCRGGLPHDKSRAETAWLLWRRRLVIREKSGKNCYPLPERMSAMGQTRTCATPKLMSAKGQKRTLVGLFDHLAGTPAVLGNPTVIPGVGVTHLRYPVCKA